MDTQEFLNCLMAEIGPIVDAQSVIAVEDFHWVVQFERSSVEVQYDEAQSKFTLESPLGVPHQTHKADLMEMVLTYNYLHSEHGGARIAQISPDVGWVVLFDLFAVDISPNDLAQVVMNFYLTSLQWSTLVQSEPDEQPIDPNALADLNMPAIRP